MNKKITIGVTLMATFAVVGCAAVSFNRMNGFVKGSGTEENRVMTLTHDSITVCKSAAFTSYAKQETALGNEVFFTADNSCVLVPDEDNLCKFANNNAYFCNTVQPDTFDTYHTSPFTSITSVEFTYEVDGAAEGLLMHGFFYEDANERKELIGRTQLIDIDTATGASTSGTFTMTADGEVTYRYFGIKCAISDTVINISSITINYSC